MYAIKFNLILSLKASRRNHLSTQTAFLDAFVFDLASKIDLSSQYHLLSTDAETRVPEIQNPAGMVPPRRFWKC